MTTILLAAIAVIKFDGGMPNDFAKLLGDNLKQNVVVSFGDPRLLGPAYIEIGDLDSMARDIRSQARLVMLPGSDLVFSDQMLSAELVLDQKRSLRRDGAEPAYRVGTSPAVGEQLFTPAFIALPAKAVTDGKVTFRSQKSEAVQLGQLAGGFGKPVQVHWVYEQAPVFIDVKDMPTLDLAKWIARAVGARFVPSEKEYRFDLDPVEVRKRAVATIKAEALPKPEEGKPNETERERDFRLSCINSLTPRQVADAMRAPGSTVRIELTPNSPLTRLAVQRIRQIEEVQRNFSEEDRRPRNAIGLLQRVDPNRAAVLLMDSRLMPYIEVPVLDANGRPNGIVRL